MVVLYALNQASESYLGGFGDFFTPFLIQNQSSHTRLGDQPCNDAQKEKLDWMFCPTNS